MEYESLLAIGTVIGAIAGAIGGFYVKVMTEKRKTTEAVFGHDRQERADAVEQLNAIIKRLDEKDLEQEKKIELLHKEHMDCEKRAAALEATQRTLVESHATLARKVRLIEQRSGEGPPTPPPGA